MWTLMPTISDAFAGGKALEAGLGLGMAKRKIEVRSYLDYF
jgi:hypothetical protein